MTNIEKQLIKKLNIKNKLDVTYIPMKVKVTLYSNHTFDDVSKTVEWYGVWRNCRLLGIYLTKYENTYLDEYQVENHAFGMSFYKYEKYGFKTRILICERNNILTGDIRRNKDPWWFDDYHLQSKFDLL